MWRVAPRKKLAAGSRAWASPSKAEQPQDFCGDWKVWGRLASEKPQANELKTISMRKLLSYKALQSAA
jgi:hypothetical protein